MKYHLLFISIAVITFGRTSAFATTGYFMHAYSAKSQGNAGTAIANFQDSLTHCNPAGLSWLDKRVDAEFNHLFTNPNAWKLQEMVMEQMVR